MGVLCVFFIFLNNSPFLKKNIIITIIMNVQFVVALLFALAITSYGQSSPSSCSYTDTNGCTYDIGALAYPDDQPLQDYYSYADGQITYYVNICSPLNDTFGELPGTTVLQTAPEGVAGNYSCGVIDTSSAFSDYAGTNPTGQCPGVTVEYFNGQACQSSNRSSTINVACDATANTATITSITEDSPCHYVIQMSSKEACGVPPATSPTDTVSASVSVSVSVSAAASPVETPTTTTSVSAAASPVETPTPTTTTSVSVAASPMGTPSISDSPSVTPSFSVGASLSVTATISTTPSTSPSISPSRSDSSSPTPSLTVGASPSNTATISITPTISVSQSVPSSSDSSGIDSWVWWVIGIVGVLVIVIIIAGAGFFVYKKKKQQSYDSIGYE